MDVTNATDSLTEKEATPTIKERLPKDTIKDVDEGEYDSILRIRARQRT